MAKADWGSKHTCQSCGAKYYDLNRSPATCPKCGTSFNPDALLRSRRPRATSGKAASQAAPAVKAQAQAQAQAKAKAKTKTKTKTKAKTADTLEAVDKELDVPIADEDDGDKVIEDVSELGEDDTDMVEVVVEDEKDET